MLRLTYRVPFFAKTVSDSSKYETSQPSASKIARRGTSTRSLSIYGSASKVSALPFTVTPIALSADTGAHIARERPRATKADFFIIIPP